MKAIESIKAQVSAIIVFTAKTFEEMNQQEKNFSERIADHSSEWKMRAYSLTRR